MSFKLSIGATAVAGIIGTVGFGAPAAEFRGQMAATPDTGLVPGATFTVENLEGSECAGGVSGHFMDEPWGAAPNGDGDWSTELTVPDGTEPGFYDVSAFCYGYAISHQVSGLAAPAQSIDFEYDVVTVTVVAAQATPPGPTPPPATGPAPAAPAPVATAPAAPAATPAAAQPRYTG